MAIIYNEPFNQTNMKKAFILMAFLGLLAMPACKKEESEPNNNNTPGTPVPNPPSTLQDNTFKVLLPDGTEQVIEMTEVWINNDNGAYAYIGRFSGGAAGMYDRVAIGFNSPPQNGVYGIMNGNSADLPDGKAQHNTTFDGINYLTNTDDSVSVTISTVAGKRKVTFENLPMHPGGTVIGGGTPLPEGSKISGNMVEP
ncbi:MAG TPA: hypothetical protein VIK71_00015 [Flavobacteriales bacterium]